MNRAGHLCNQLNNTTRLLDFLLRLPAHISRSHNDRNLGQPALAEDLAVTEGQKVEDGGGILFVAADVLVSCLSGDERPELVEVDGRFPEFVLGFVEAAGMLAYPEWWDAGESPKETRTEEVRHTISYRLYPAYH